MLRELVNLPTAPVRLLDDVREVKELVRDLLATEEGLAHFGEVIAIARSGSSRETRGIDSASHH